MVTRGQVRYESAVHSGSLPEPLFRKQLGASSPRERCLLGEGSNCVCMHDEDCRCFEKPDRIIAADPEDDQELLKISQNPCTSLVMQC